MRYFTPFKRVVCLIAVLPWTGCLGKAPLRPTPSAQTPEIPKNDLSSHLMGRWELPGKAGNVKTMIFEPGGKLTFEGGLDYFNPAEWQLDSQNKELKLSFPQTPNEKLDIFHMYVGQGVQAFNRARKEVTYHFDAQTWSLLIAGWTYSKPDNPIAAPLAEPVLH